MKFPEHPLDVLVIAPHPDDAEISVGGTVVSYRRRGKRVGVLDLTDGEPTPHGSPELRREETLAASRILALAWRDNLGLPNRSLRNTLDARRRLAGVLRQTRPQVILAPYREDAHPDHTAASQLVDEARFWAKLTRTDLPGEPYLPPHVFYYWSIHLRVHPRPAFVIDISDGIDTKMDAVRAFRSQVITGRSDQYPTIPDQIRDIARYWGWTIGTAFGEPFACREEIGLTDFDAIL